MFRPRSADGSILADYTAALVVFLVFMIWPFVDYVTIGCNYFLLRDLVHNACQAAAASKTFSSGSSSNAVMDSVPTAINSKATKYPGVQVTDTKVRINQTSLTQTITHGNWGQRWTQSTVDPVKNVYTIEVALTANLKPLIPYSGPGMDSIPGLTGPMTVTYASQLMSENPLGLSQ